MKVIVQEGVSLPVRASLSSLNNFGMLFIFFSGLDRATSAYTDWNLLSFCET